MAAAGPAIVAGVAEAAVAAVAGHVGDLALNDDVFNGETYIGGQEGETLENKLHHRVLVPAVFPMAPAPFADTPLDITQRRDFLRLNTLWIKINRPTLTAGQCYRLALIRLMAYRRGHISPAFAAGDHFCRHNEVVILPAGANVQAQFNAYVTACGLDASRPGAAAGGAAYTLVEYGDMAMNAITPAEREAVVKKYTDIVCAVAIIFRARAHHYTGDIQPTYVKLWEKCRYDPDEVVRMGGWENVATVAVHAIYPDVLDRILLEAVANKQCNGALAKRVDTPCAGTAIVRSTLAGYRDIRTVFDKFDERVPNGTAYLAELNALFAPASARWLGGVNKHLYGVTSTFVVDEGRLAPIAAAIKSIYETLADQATLQDSMALKRVANSAPVVGAVLGRAAQRAVNDERLSLLPPAE